MPLDHGPAQAPWPQPHATASEGFEASRLRFADRLAPARIPVERIKAPLLLFGSGQDTTWPSARMAQTIAEQRAATDRGLTTDLMIYPLAGHQICASPYWPVRLYEHDGEGGSRLDTDAEGEAAVDVWLRTIKFLTVELHARVSQ